MISAWAISRVGASPRLAISMSRRCLSAISDPARQPSGDQLRPGKDRPQPVAFCLDILAATFFTIYKGHNTKHLETFLFCPANRLHGGAAGGNHILDNDDPGAGRQVLAPL